ncbi:hypothetical protein SHXM_01777 [Streptomyces hygroscopicus]|nr:hypothetical protein SHXM_01777 [Streptomyces hygroscopicus]
MGEAAACNCCGLAVVSPCEDDGDLCVRAFSRQLFQGISLHQIDRQAPGNATPAATARRGRASMTGQPPNCPPSTTSTATSPPINDGHWLAAAWPARRRSRTTSPTHRMEPPSLSWYASPEPAGRSRKPSRPRRTSADWTNTRSAGIPAGTGTSPWPCSPTPSSPPWPPLRGRKRGQQKRFRRPRTAHRGRNPATPGSWQSPVGAPSAHRPRDELVLLATPAPGHRPPLPLPPPHPTSRTHNV